ncbi:MAG: dihydroxyacetone kinase phosphoryl donor subunit DhaM [Eubacterium sp.]
MTSTGIVIVSHSAKLAEGLVDIVSEMNDGSVKIMAAGGADEGRIGTNALKIMSAIESMEDCNNILLYVDMGSSVISTEAAIDMIDEDLAEKVQVVDCPLVEGAFAGVVQATITDDVDAIIRVSKEAKEMPKC